MAKESKISGLLKATALSVVLAAIVWFVGLVFNPPGLEMVLAIAAIVFSIISICLVVCCIAEKINSQVSLYKVFAIADIVLGVLAGGYAVYDIRTDTGWFADKASGKSKQPVRRSVPETGDCQSIASDRQCSLYFR